MESSTPGAKKSQKYEEWKSVLSLTLHLFPSHINLLKELLLYSRSELQTTCKIILFYIEIPKVSGMHSVKLHVFLIKKNSNLKSIEL